MKNVKRTKEEERAGEKGDIGLGLASLGFRV
jgi:hypothetical protein